MDSKTTDFEEEIFWKQSNKLMLESIFAGNLSKKMSQPELEKYIPFILSSKDAVARKEKLSRNQLRVLLNAYLDGISETYKNKAQHPDLDHRFDAIVQKKQGSLLFDCLDEISTIKSFLNFFKEFLSDFKDFKIIICLDLLDSEIMLGKTAQHKIMLDKIKEQNTSLLFLDDNYAFLVPRELIK